jgi:hypothetical protein
MSAAVRSGLKLESPWLMMKLSPGGTLRLAFRLGSSKSRFGNFGPNGPGVTGTDKFGSASRPGSRRNAPGRSASPTVPARDCTPAGGPAGQADSPALPRERPEAGPGRAGPGRRWGRPLAM